MQHKDSNERQMFGRNAADNRIYFLAVPTDESSLHGAASYECEGQTNSLRKNNEPEILDLWRTFSQLTI